MSAYAGPEIISNGLVLALDAGNKKSYPGSGANVIDIINNKTGTLTANTTYSSDNGGYFSIPEGLEYISIPKDDTLLAYSGDFTMEAWFMLTSTPVLGWPSMIFSSWSSNSLSADSWFAVYVLNNRTLVCELKGQASSVSHQTLVTLNSWNHVVLVRSNNVFRTYLNKEASTSSGTSSTNLVPTINTWIGSYSASTQYSIKGRVSQYKIYNGYAFTSDDVIKNYNALRGRFGI